MPKPRLGQELRLQRCPHCNVDQPNLTWMTGCQSTDYGGGTLRFWGVYACKRCGGCILCGTYQPDGEIEHQYPSGESLYDENIPSRACSYLEQAAGSLHVPAGALMLAASAVDAMLKAKGYTKDESLYARINQAVNDHLITEDMGKWAHEVRLEANDQRHVDEKSALPTGDDAKRVVEFAKSLALFLFVLPARVTRAIKDAKGATKKA